MEETFPSTVISDNYLTSELKVAKRYPTKSLRRKKRHKEEVKNINPCTIEKVEALKNTMKSLKNRGLIYDLIDEKSEEFDLFNLLDEKSTGE